MQKFCFLLLFSFLFPFKGLSYDVIVDGIYYNLNKTKKTATVTYCSTSNNPYQGDVIIPPRILTNNEVYLVTEISNSAFISSSIETLTIPSTVNSIGDYAFNYCRLLKSLIIEDSNELLYIGISKVSTYYWEGAFINTSLEKVYLGRPYVTTYYGDIIEYDNRKSVSDAEPFRYIKTLKEVTIRNIDNLRSGCFYGCINLESIDFGETVEIIGGGAFSGCENLTSITIPNSVKEIRANAFSGCPIKYLDLGNSVETIGSGAIPHVNVEKLTLPKSLTYIDGWNFSNSFINELIIEEGNNSDLSISWGEAGGTFLRSTIPNIYIGRNPWILSQYLFSGNETIERISFHDNVTSIASNAFKGCSNLKDIKWSSKIIQIGQDAFNGCNSISAINLPSSVSELGSGCFANCKGLESFRMNNNVSTIPSSCFMNCENLISVSFGEKIEDISSNSFENCKNLKQIDLPNTLKSLGLYSFRNTGLTQISIPVEIENLPISVFENCENLTIVQFNKNLKSIDKNAFFKCNISEVHIPDLKNFFDLQIVKEGSPFTGKTSLIINDTKINELEIPSYINTIQQYKFWGIQLNKIIVNNNVTTIEDNAFSGIDGLTSMWYFADGNLLSYKSQLPDNNDRLTIWCNANSYNTLSKKFSDYDVRMIPLGKINYQKSWICGYDFSFKDGLEIPTPYTIEIKNLKGELIQTINSNNDNLYHVRGLFPNTSYIADIIINYNESTILYSLSFSTLPLKGEIKLTKQTETSLTLNINLEKDETVPEIQQYGGMLNDEIIWWNDKTHTYNSLNPNSTYFVYPIVRIYGQDIQLTANSFKTKNINVVFDKSSHPTDIQVRAKWNSGDAVIKTYYFEDMEENSDVLSKHNLKPNSIYKYNFYLVTDKDYKLYYNGDVTTTSLIVKTLPVCVTKDGQANVSAETNISNLESGAGFQWKKYDAPASLDPNESYAIVYDGILEGQIKNLQSTSYYNVRAFYKANDGTYYYSDWVTFDPSDFSYFDPTVRTYGHPEISQNSVTLTGNVLGGSDDIINQGFQYWNNDIHSRSADNITTIYSNGQLMKSTIENLADGNYTYRAFAETTKGFYYGDEQTFSIDVSAVEEIIADKYNIEIIGYYNVNGQRFNEPRKGFNIVLYSDGTTKKIIIK